MIDVLIMFDKSLVIDEEDFKVFENENYKIDDGTIHLFNKEVNCLLVEDSDKNPILAVFFEKKMFENKQYYKISRIKYRLNKDIVKNGANINTQREVISIIVETFQLLDNILFKRKIKDEKEDDNTIHNYIIYDENSHTFDKLATFGKRVKYVDLLSKLEYLFVFV